jgi:hypothetical protein
MDQMTNEHLPSIKRMSRDLRQAAVTLSDQEARFLVDSYYAMQTSRIREAGRVRAMQKKDRAQADNIRDDEGELEVRTAEEETRSDIGEPHSVIGWLFDQNWILETAIKGALQRYAEASPIGRWALDQHGIGPVISAGMLAYFDPLYPTVGHMFSFAGLDPTVKWNKGEKRPWSHSAKQLAFKIGDSMLKHSNHPKCLYGQLYRARKRKETLRNERGDYAAEAAETLRTRNFDKSTEAYKAYSIGKFPKGRIDLRARRIATKMFMSHWHTVAHYHATGRMPPWPYAIVHAGHAHYIAPPGFDQKTFPIADPAREPHAETLESFIEREIIRIETFEEAARLTELEDQDEF